MKSKRLGDSLPASIPSYSPQFSPLKVSFEVNYSADLYIYFRRCCTSLNRKKADHNFCLPDPNEQAGHIEMSLPSVLTTFFAALLVLFLCFLVHYMVVVPLVTFCIHISLMDALFRNGVPLFRGVTLLSIVLSLSRFSVSRPSSRLLVSFLRISFFFSSSSLFQEGVRGTEREREREEVAIVPTRKNACSNKKGTDAKRERERESERTRRGLNLVFARSFRSTVVGGQGKKKRSSQHGLNVWSRVQTNVNQGTTR